MCKMSKAQDECECKSADCTEQAKLVSEESQCCKTKFNEINNTNTLESNKVLPVKEIPFQFNDYFLKSGSNAELSYSLTFDISHFRPPADIPILFSHILI